MVPRTSQGATPEGGVKVAGPLRVGWVLEGLCSWSRAVGAGAGAPAVVRVEGVVGPRGGDVALVPTCPGLRVNLRGQVVGIRQGWLGDIGREPLNYDG